LAELLTKAGNGDFLRSVAEAAVQLFMETDAEGLIGASRLERSSDRTTCRNGDRDPTLDTPKLGGFIDESEADVLATMDLPAHTAARSTAQNRWSV